eukprot:4590041-Pleurochrysis_carterae.AAC.2
MAKDYPRVKDSACCWSVSCSLYEGRPKPSLRNDRVRTRPAFAVGPDICADILDDYYHAHCNA